MKRHVHANQEATPNISTNKELVDFLKSKGIDTTKQKYKLSYVFYDRDGDENFSLKFTCPGDYLALFSTTMLGIFRSALQQCIPNIDNLQDFYDSATGEEGLPAFIDVVNRHPTYESLYSYGEANEWFGREEFGNIQLKNLANNDFLVYEDDDWYEEEYDDDDWDE